MSSEHRHSAVLRTEETTSNIKKVKHIYLMIFFNLYIKCCHKMIFKKFHACKKKSVFNFKKSMVFTDCLSVFKSVLFCEQLQMKFPCGGIDWLSRSSNQDVCDLTGDSAFLCERQQCRLRLAAFSWYWCDWRSEQSW